MFKNLALSSLLFFLACGTIIGNGFRDPTTGSTQAIDLPLQFDHAIMEYNASNYADCGSFDENSTQVSIDLGRQCIRDALDSCTPSKYLLNKHNPSGSRFVSFVSVKEVEPGTCKLRVHTISNVSPENIGDRIESCFEIDPDEIPEVACGILD